MTRSGQHAVAAETVFDGDVLHKDAAVVVDGSRILSIVPRAQVPPTIDLRSLPDGVWLAPGFIDLQVNGGGDVLFNESATAEGVSAIAAAHRKFGTTALLPTLITDTTAKMKQALDAVQSLVETEPSVIGIHFEGPFLSPEKRGVHNLNFIRGPTAADRDLLTAPRKGVMLVTLAPEQVPPGFIAQLAQAGIVVALGHSMASYEQTRMAMAEGLTGFTHLFNAMRTPAAREPGPIVAALEGRDSWFGMIVDGAHVHPAMLRLALRGAGHPMLVTDAMPPVGGRRTDFSLHGEPIALREGRLITREGTLAGAFLDMGKAVRNCVRLLDVPLTEALRFASTNPANFIGLGHSLGKLAPGYRADMVALEASEMNVIDTWVAGR